MRYRAVARVVVFTSACVATVGPAVGMQSPPSGFVAVAADRVEWRPLAATPGAYTAVLVGHPDKAGPLVLRLKLPPNTRIQPHTHPDARTYTVLSGDWKLGFGSTFDERSLQTFTSGGLYRLPAGVPHFQASGSVETIVQIESIGPTRRDPIPPAAGAAPRASHDSRVPRR